MNKTFMRFCSMLLTIIMVINLLPINILATEIQESIDARDINVEVVHTESTGMEDAYIVEEVIDGRTEFSKEYRLSNGLHMAAMFAEPVHYELDGKWEEIDNTLKISNGMYVNTAGVWDVSFPQQLNTNAPVSITKDGYTLSFYMSGEMRSGSGNLEVAAIGVDTESYTLQSAQLTTAQIQQIDLTLERAASQFPEAVSDKNHARLQYENVFSNTDIRYDLQSNQVKESIIIESYDSALRGYKYTLNVGELTPVLTDSGEIQLYDETKENIVMVMPAPFLVDNAGEYSDDVTVALVGKGSTYTLTYTLPQSWLAAEERQWPVILDPVVDAGTDTNNIRDASVYQKNAKAYTYHLLEVGHNSDNGIMRIFYKYRNLPTLTSADVIVAASINLPSAYNYTTDRVIEAHKVLENWESESITWTNQPDFNPLTEDYATVNGKTYFSWDITDIVREWYEGKNYGVMFKARDHIENTSSTTSYTTQFYASDYSTTTCPQLFICFRNNNGLESYWDYTASSAGRAGTGYVNNYTGNLVWVRSDIGYGGNRMPVSISHVYNANDSQINDFGMGYGWRTNFNQLVYQWNEDSDYYVWEDSDGTKHYFKKVSSGKYEDEDGLEMTLTTTGSGATRYKIVDKNGNASYFDTVGRLTKQENNQLTKSSISITYTNTSEYLINTITDGAGRKYTFTYNSSDLLTKISYTGSGTDPLGYVSFGYSSSKLITITDKDGEKCTYTYGSNNLLTSATDIDGYKLSYTYLTTAAGMPNRISKVCEYDGTTAGGELTIAYGHNQTTFTDVSGNVQILQFNNWGNTVSIQDGEGRAQYAQYANNDSTSSSTAKGNQLTLASKLQNTVGNVLNNSSFEGTNTWTVTSSAVTQSVSTEAAYRGSKSLKLTRSTSGSGAGVSGPSFTVKAGETYTFSAYLKTGNLSGYIALTGGSTTVTSTTVAANSDWIRVEVPFTASANTTVTPKLLVSGSGSMYMDCVQIEKAPTSSRYNLVENGDFRHGTNGWEFSTYYEPKSDKIVTVDSSPAPELDNHVLRIAGDPTVFLRAYKYVQVSGSAGDTFVASAWAKGKSVAMTTENGCIRSFAMRVQFYYTDGSAEAFKFDFNPHADNVWQYRSGVVVASKAYSKMEIQLFYDYNMNTVYFDGIQLYKEQFGNSYTYDDDGNVISVVDLQKQTTEYEYTNNDLTKQILPSGAELNYTYDDYHNVKTATTEEGLSYAFAYDKYGNNTSVSIVNGSSKITSTATYSSDGNRLLSTTDALGNTTTYNYNANTNVLEWVQYPEDTTETRTEYTYDTMYRMAEAAVTTDSGLDLTARYTYEDDLLTKIQTGSTTYNFAYGNFALRSSIQVGSTNLASYTYEARTNRLTQLDYGNGDKVQYTYDQQGRITRETYEDGAYVTYQYDNSGALATVYDSESGITATYYYDFIDRMMKYVEKGTGYSHSVGYEYDEINNLTAMVDTINGTKHTTTYAYDDDNRVTTVTNGNASETYTYDAYGRVTKKVTKHGTGTVTTETFTYKTNSSGAPTGQVATVKITGSYNVTYTYAYDKNGNITSVSDGTNTTTYAYDSANQLIRENNQAAGKTTVWTYDNAGNIESRTEYAYTTGTVGTVTDTTSYAYGNSNWRDLLTSYDGQTITHDQIGNPLTDGVWTYTWQHGRELASMTATSEDGLEDTSINFGYNSDGLRTRKIITTNSYEVVYQHSYTETVVPPTCTENGYTLYECECGDSYHDNEVTALGHNYIATVVEGTDTSSGYTVFTCSSCNESYTECEHDYMTSFVVNPMCTTEGYTHHECACGYTYKTDILEPLGHNYVSTSTNTQRCTRCGIIKPDIEVPGLPPVDTEIMSVGEDVEVASYSVTEETSSVSSACEERVLVSSIVEEHAYVYTGSSLMQEVITTTTTVNGETSTTTETLNFSYDASDSPMTVTYGGTTYYYATNLQGDVIAILNTSGTTVVEYTYDAWGNLLTTSGSMADTLGEANSLRYRGYVYDTETGLYYLQSRYYDPEMGRFINADAFASTGQGLLGNNMFTYCLNNPVNFVDRDGENPEALQWWMGSMWWLCGIDSVLPIGDIIYCLGSIVFLYDAYNTICGPTLNVDLSSSNEANQSSAPAVSDSISTPGSPKKPDNENKKPSLKRLTKYLIKQMGIDPHALKYEYLGKGAEIKLYDLAYDTVTGIVYIITKAGQIVAETYYNVFENIPLW